MALLLLVLPFALMWQLFSSDAASARMMKGDVLVQAFPSRHLVHEYHNLDRAPDWNPFQMSGMPLAGDVQVAPYYVPNIILDVLLTGQELSYKHLEALIVFHYSLAGLFCFLYLRAIRLGSGAALVGALAFQFNGFFVGHRGHFNMFAAAVWTMASLWTLEKLFRSRGLKEHLVWSLGSAFCLCQIATAGHPQQALYGTVFLTAYAIYRNFSESKAIRLVWFAFAGSLAVGLASNALLPAMELILASDRSEPTLQFAQEYSLLPRNLIGLLFPEFAGWSGTEFRIYPGLLTLVLANVALVSEKNEYVRFFIGLFCLATFAALGGFTALHSLLYLVLPGFGSMRVTARIFFFANLALAVLAAVGTQRIQSMSEATLASISRSWGMLCGLIALALASVYGDLLEAGAGVPESFYTREMFEPVTERVSLAGLTHHANALVLGLLFLISALAIVHWGVKSGRSQSLWLASCAVLMIVDLGTYAVKHDTTAGDPTDLLFQQVGFEVRLLTESWERQEHMELVRKIQSLDPTLRIDNKGVLPANFSQVYGVKFWDGYNILDLKERVDIKKRTRGLEESRLYDIFGVGYVLTMPQSEDSKRCADESYRLLFQNSQGQIWERASLPQYLSFSEDYRVVGSSEATRHFLGLAGAIPLIAEQSSPSNQGPYRIGSTGQASPISLSLSSPGPQKQSCIVIGSGKAWFGIRGLSVVAIEPETGRVTGEENFDTYVSQYESRRFATYIAGLPEGTIVAICSSDEAFSQLESSARAALRSLGGSSQPNLNPGTSYCLVGVVGAAEGTGLEVSEPAAGCTLDLGQPVLHSNDESEKAHYQVLESKYNEIAIRVQNEKSGLLTLKESFYPGWEVQVDGRWSEALKTQGVSMGALIPVAPDGGQIIRFRFRSHTLRWGNYFTVASSLLFLCLALLAGFLATGRVIPTLMRGNAV